MSKQSGRDLRKRKNRLARMRNFGSERSRRRSDVAKCEPCGSKATLLQRANQQLGPQDHVPPMIEQVLRSPGGPLEGPTKNLMESRFGHDFSGVRIHTDGGANRSADSIGARAYTIGEDIVFGRAEYQPDTVSGRRTLVHELVHAVQQRSVNPAVGPVKLVPQPWSASEKEARRAEIGTAFKIDVHTKMQSPVIQMKEGASRSDALTRHASRLLQAFDVERKKHGVRWDLDMLTKKIFKALSASDRAFVRIIGNYPTEANEPDPKGKAWERANIVKQALIQWIGPRFSESRYEVAFGSGRVGGRQVEVWISYKPRVISQGTRRVPAPFRRSRPPRRVQGRHGQVSDRPKGPLKEHPIQRGSVMDIISALLATEKGKQLKEAGLEELERVWDHTSLGEKILIFSSLFVTAGISTYTVTKMPSNQQSMLLEMIIGDDDRFMEKPLERKTIFSHTIHF